jgi:hypothetical protein
MRGGLGAIWRYGGIFRKFLAKPTAGSAGVAGGMAEEILHRLVCCLVWLIGSISSARLSTGGSLRGLSRSESIFCCKQPAQTFAWGCRAIFRGQASFWLILLFRF